MPDLELHGFSLGEFRDYRALADNQLNKLPQDIDSSIIAVALNNLVKIYDDFSQNSDLSTSLDTFPVPLKERLRDLKEILDNSNYYVVNSQKGMDFREVIIDRVREQISALEQMQGLSPQTYQDYREHVYEQLNKIQLTEDEDPFFTYVALRDLSEGKPLDLDALSPSTRATLLTLEKMMNSPDDTWKKKGDENQLRQAFVGFIKEEMASFNTPVIEKIRQNLNLESSSQEIEQLLARYTQDRAVMKEAIMKNPEAFEFAHPDLQNDRQFIIELLKEDALIISQVPEKFNQDKEIILTAVERGDAFAAIQFASPEIRDREFLLTAIEKNSRVMQGLTEEEKKILDAQ